jgi:hypothetical protein
MKPDIPSKAPGQKMIKRMPLRTKWLLCGGGGLLLVGLGISVVATAAVKKADINVAFITWFFMGLYGLIITNLGLVCFGQAVRFRVMMDMNKRLSKQEKDLAKRFKRTGKPQEKDDTKK